MTAQQRMQIQIDKQESQIEDLFKSVRDIKNMNLKVISGFKGLLIGFALMVGADFGIGDLLMKML
tara:strand:- start:36 stop:230 length:195 start_codon:yes stop_codon:yes gene_type:complete